MGQERIWTLLSRKLANEALDAEITELNNLLQLHPEFIPAVQQIIENWEQPINNDPEFMEATYLIHLERMKTKGLFLPGSELENTDSLKQSPSYAKNIRKNLSYLLVTCSLICLVFIAAHFSSKSKPVFSVLTNNGNLTHKKEIVTENGTRTKTQLPDGSVVWLNAGSKVTYAGDLSGPLREVYLDGEAYFDVVKNPSRPFIVHTGNINIRVLGTAFNVKSYSLDKTIETTLLRGLIEITNQNDSTGKAVFLHPNQKIVIARNSAAALSINPNAISKVDMPNEKGIPETAWMFNRLSFRGDDFIALAQKMERWYNVKIVFGDDAVKKLHFNGAFENETVEQSLEALQMANPFIYKINNNEIYISSVPN